MLPSRCRGGAQAVERNQVLCVRLFLCKHTQNFDFLGLFRYNGLRQTPCGLCVSKFLLMDTLLSCVLLLVTAGAAGPAAAQHAHGLTSPQARADKTSINNDVLWVSNMEFGCTDRNETSCSYRRFPGMDAAVFNLAAPFNANLEKPVHMWDEVHERRYFYVESEQECIQLCCGLREHCDVYVFKAVTPTRSVCVYFSMDDPFAPDRIEAKGKAMQSSGNSPGARRPLTVTGVSVRYKFFESDEKRIEEEYLENLAVVPPPMPILSCVDHLYVTVATCPAVSLIPSVYLPACTSQTDLLERKLEACTIASCSYNGCIRAF